MANVNAPQLRNIKAHIADQTLILPEEILSRLPVKSLLRFRCVSKSWRSLIGSKRFVKTHLENSTKDTSFAHHRIIILSDLPKCRPKHCSLHSLLNEPFTDSFTFDFSIKTRWDSIYLVGCCNGLVCVLLDEKYFVLWNPSTRMSKKLPDIDREGKHLHAWVCGFGCDESSGDYKVFGMICGRDGDVCKLYSLKTDSWKVIESSGNGGRFFGYGKFASGKLHWRRKFGSARDWDIVSLDLNGEVYGVVEQPSYSGGHFRGSIGVLGGCLCVPCYYENDCVDVWVMKQYGVKESWDKVVSVPDLHVPPRGHFLTPFCIGPNGEILLIYGSTFIIYSPKDNGFRHHWIIDFDSFREVGIYTESLVSLVPDSEQEGQTSEPVA